MPELLAKHLHEWLEKRYTPNPDGYLCINSKARPYLSDNVVKYGVHRAMAKLGIVTPRVHVGIHCFRHGVTSELLEFGTPIHVVTRLMRHGDSQVTVNPYAHIIGNAERVASEHLSRKIEAQLESIGVSEVDSNSVSRLCKTPGENSTACANRGSQSGVPQRMTRRLLGSRSISRSLRGLLRRREFLFWVSGITDRLAGVKIGSLAYRANPLRKLERCGTMSYFCGVENLLGLSLGLLLPPVCFGHLSS
jgi:hypothetical protein